ncbi:Crp/Fnr family transcriptional regulator [Sodalinema gerasimenkoae]|uniref:Crp/Fnr family transcriptional regulator n=1 Tax=Sodalinema gerasimenkoae TaxID=2862348 RepID=UPI001356E991|nr:cyclic nucleotide-binding domain-containing protein [Sodalinema gerasimenkoae]
MDFPDRLLHRLKQTPLTANLSESEQQQLLELSSYCEAEAGQLVFAEGSPSDHLWLLLEGEGERLQEAESGQLLLLGGVRAGDTLSALDFLLERPYSSSLRATSDCSLFMIHRQHWQRLLNGSRVGSKLALRLVAMAQQHFEQGLAATEALLETYQQAIALLRPPESSEEGVDYSLWAQIQESRDRLEKQQQMLRKQLPLATPKPTRSSPGKTTADVTQTIAPGDSETHAIALSMGSVSGRNGHGNGHSGGGWGDPLDGVRFWQERSREWSFWGGLGRSSMLWEASVRKSHLICLMNSSTAGTQPRRWPNEPPPPGKATIE